MCGLTCEGSVRTTIADFLDDARERGGASSVGCSRLRYSKSTAAAKKAVSNSPAFVLQNRHEPHGHVGTGVTAPPRN